LGREINKEFVREMVMLNEKYKVNVAGEGGEYESFVVNCPLFEEELEVIGFKDSGEGNSWGRELELK